MFQHLIKDIIKLNRYKTQRSKRKLIIATLNRYVIYGYT